MTDDANKQSQLAEYREFTETMDREVPLDVSARIHATLFPNPFTVFAKISGVHVMVGFVSLAFCHQFGLNPFQTETSLAQWFMNLGGHRFCMLACGVVFMVTTYLLANLFLTLEELEAVRRHKWLEVGTLTLVSLAAFYFFGADLVFVFALLWTVGAFIGGWMSLEASYALRRALA